MRLRKPRPLLRATVEFINAANGLHPVSRNPRASVLVFCVRLADLGGAGPLRRRLHAWTPSAAAGAAISPDGKESWRWP